MPYYYLNMEKYQVDEEGAVRRKPEWRKVPKGKAAIKAEKRRTHRHRHYFVIRTLRNLQKQMTEKSL